jgi:hypothetical protein
MGPEGGVADGLLSGSDLQCMAKPSLSVSHDLLNTSRAKGINTEHPSLLLSFIHRPFFALTFKSFIN